MKKILVSACLYGEGIVRYDAAQVQCDDPRFLKWKAEGRLIPVCPEVAGGLKVPRPPAQRRGEIIVTEDGTDVTDAYEKGAEAALRLAEENEVAFAIMKEKSPSCGSSRIKDGTFTGKNIGGQGLTTEYLRQAGFIVLSEEELPEAERLVDSLL
ncbi:MAG: DUF523 domain-containing protein [Clostridiales Family XIII bacterium]|jgi:uncharacterized protein YbbK (DUF523 family)|nr:DUF523 domain-containing protein [Clostridiales Family XIII bacterium]